MVVATWGLSLSLSVSTQTYPESNPTYYRSNENIFHFETTELFSSFPPPELKCALLFPWWYRAKSSPGGLLFSHRVHALVVFKILAYSKADSNGFSNSQIRLPIRTNPLWHYFRKSAGKWNHLLHWHDCHYLWSMAEKTKKKINIYLQ